MPFVAGALLPHPPLLVRELCGGSPEELEELRAACLGALTRMTEVAEALVLVGDGAVWGRMVAGAGASFGPYGAPVHVELVARGDPLPLADLPEPALVTDLPLSLAVAATLLGQLSPEELHGYTVPAALGSDACAAIGRALAAGVATRRAAVVALGDLSSWRAATAATAMEAESDRLEDAVRTAIAQAELARLAELDPVTAATLVVPARAPLQVLAGALGGAAGLRGSVRYDAAPYAVRYLVGVLEPA